MHSLKKFISLTTFILVILLMILISFNAFYINNLTERVFETHQKLEAINANYIDLDLPLRVIKNIANQNLSEESFNNNRNISEAYQRNLNDFINTSAYIKVLFEDTEKLFNQYNDYFFISELELFKIPNQSFKSSYRSFVTLNEMSESLYEKKPVDTEDINQLISVYKTNEPDIETINNLFDRSIFKAFNKIKSLNNIMITITIMIIVILIAIILRFMNVDLKYITTAIHNISQKNYNAVKLNSIRPIFSEEARIKKNINDIVDELVFVEEVKKATNKGYLLTDVIEQLFKTIEKELHVDRVGVAFVNYETEEIIAEYGESNYSPLYLEPGYTVKFEETSLYSLILNPQTIVTNDVPALYEKKKDSLSLKLINQESIKSNVIFPLIVDDSVFGFMFFSSRKRNAFDKKAIVTGENIAQDLANIVDKTFLTKLMFSEMTTAFSDLVEKKDSETGEHLDRMVEYSKFISERLLSHPDKDYRISRRLIREIIIHAPAHDIGKVGIPDHILKKPGKLTKEEFELMKNHPTIGANIFRDLKKSLQIFNQDFFEVAENITRYHHEKWNGLGYPEGLAGLSIPIEARIVAIADVFDALTSKRVYKGAFNFEKAWDIIIDSSGTHFDPVLINLLNDNKDAFYQLYENLH